MEKITVDQIMKWRPCGHDGSHDGRNYTRRRVEELFDGKKALSAREIAALDLPQKDVVWALIRMLDTTQQRDFARWVALQVGHLWDMPDTVRRYLETGSESLRDAANDVANAAANDADAESATATYATEAATAHSNTATEAAYAAAWYAITAASYARDTAFQRAMVARLIEMADGDTCAICNTPLSLDSAAPICSRCQEIEATREADVRAETEQRRRPL